MTTFDTVNQLALNYLVFVEKRRLQSEEEEAMVWMDIDDQDIESYEYVRLFTTRSSTEKRDIEHKWETANAIHCFLLIALIKIKRLQQVRPLTKVICFCIFFGGGGGILFISLIKCCSNSLGLGPSKGFLS